MTKQGKTMEQKLEKLVELDHEEPQRQDDKWTGCCYESELDSFNGKGYEQRRRVVINL